MPYMEAQKWVSGIPTAPQKRQPFKSREFHFGALFAEHRKILIWCWGAPPSQQQPQVKVYLGIPYYNNIMSSWWWLFVTVWYCCFPTLKKDAFQQKGTKKRTDSESQGIGEVSAWSSVSQWKTWKFHTLFATFFYAVVIRKHFEVLSLSLVQQFQCFSIGFFQWVEWSRCPRGNCALIHGEDMVMWNKLQMMPGWRSWNSQQRVSPFSTFLFREVPFGQSRVDKSLIKNDVVLKLKWKSEVAFIGSKNDFM